MAYVSSYYGELVGGGYRRNAQIRVADRRPATLKFGSKGTVDSRGRGVEGQNSQIANERLLYPPDQVIAPISKPTRTVIELTCRYARSELILWGRGRKPLYQRRRGRAAKEVA